MLVENKQANKLHVHDTWSLIITNHIFPEIYIKVSFKNAITIVILVILVFGGGGRKNYKKIMNKKCKHYAVLKKKYFAFTFQRLKR